MRRPKPKIKHTRVTHALSRSRLPDLDYALNPYVGCLHGCIYCYARLYTSIPDAAESWGSIVYVKDNLIESLRRDMSRFPPGVVGVGTVTDPYQPVEALYKLTRSSIEILLRHGFHVSIQTKNTLVLRDLDILTQYRERVDVGFTITTLDNAKAGLIEPWASPPRRRSDALTRISAAGVETWIFYGPVIPGINDDHDTAESIVGLASKTNSKLLIDSLHVKKFMLAYGHPLRIHAYLARSYDWDGFYEMTMKLCEEYGVECVKGLAEPSSHRKNRRLDEFLGDSLKKTRL